ncbi:MAG: hypothetical protein ABTQ34_03590 [Bdellovibrionales bacterium]
MRIDIVGQISHLRHSGAIQLASGSERNRTNSRPPIVSAIESLSRRRRGAAGFRLSPE